MKHAKKLKLAHKQEKKQLKEMITMGAQMLDLADKGFKATIINIFKEPKESLLKEVKENVMTMSYQIENINTEINYFKNGNFEVEKYN